MAENPPNTMLKIIWLVHFVLSSWAMMSVYITVNTYLYTHAVVLAFGFWAIVSSESAESVLMFLITLSISILNDILCIAIYEPRGHDRFEKDGVPANYRNEYRWALGMSITNLIIKPVSLFLLYRIYQSRFTGTEFTPNIPGLPSFGSSGSGHGYNNIDDARDPHTSKPGYSPPYRAPSYQETPTAYNPPSPSAPGPHQGIKVPVNNDSSDA